MSDATLWGRHDYWATAAETLAQSDNRLAAANLIRLVVICFPSNAEAGAAILPRGSFSYHWRAHPPHDDALAASCDAVEVDRPCKGPNTLGGKAFGCVSQPGGHEGSLDARSGFRRTPTFPTGRHL